MALLARVRGDGLAARVLRGSGVIGLGYVVSQVIRLGANLILTRLLFPEAFGLMSLVTMFIIGLAMLSDLGIGPSIVQNKRGDDRDFLDTAWTLQILRAALLSLMMCALAIPAAHFYSAPDLALMLPVAAITVMIAGFNPTRMESAVRHMSFGRLTLVDISSQILSTSFMIVVAYLTNSVWALVWGGIAQAVVRLVIADRLLPGPRNRLRLEREAAFELIHFGKWIFLSSMFSFLLTQGDKAVLGRFLSMADLGIYNIGYFIASFPMMLASNVVGRMMLPLYRASPPADSPENFYQLRRMRFVLTALIFGMLTVAVFAGPQIIALLYDDRYAEAGRIVSLIACAQMPMVIGLTYDSAALAAGNSRGVFVVNAVRAVVMLVAMVIGAHLGGLSGAIIAQGIAGWISYPVLVRLARQAGAWDALHDLCFALLAVALTALSFALHLG